MPIVCRLPVVLAEKRVRSLTRLARQAGVSRSTLTRLWYNRTEGITFDTLAKLCASLDCQPGDLLAYVPDRPGDAGS